PRPDGGVSTNSRIAGTTSRGPPASAHMRRSLPKRTGAEVVPPVCWYDTWTLTLAPASNVTVFVKAGLQSSLQISATFLTQFASQPIEQQYESVRQTCAAQK